ncbi:MAG TPA: hypothetical protein PLJ61_04210 [Bacteroidales bacterium]|nr:hypothetical protein [Bacteroidales bacterium]MCZ2316551.1 gliding motility lipoprotein GldH [Bacteroidales bacterium]HOQ95653.1 hypothetical protein [Bacteroidales bacterium]HPY65649.1 hypothetical protein [Bacteroidales bacterium]HQF05686.1 hypothetical protein [Bacteroidales bacterium]
MARKHHRLPFCLMAGAILTAASCSPPSSSQVQQVIPGGTWEKSHILTLTLQAPDTAGRYDSFLDIRVTPKYAHSYMSIIMIHDRRKDTLWLSLLGGNAIRSGVFTDYRFPLDTAGFAADKPYWSWQLSHNMLDQALDGIATIGLLIKKHGHGKR